MFAVVDMATPTTTQIIAHFRPAVARDMILRGERIKRAAQANLRGSGRGPRRVNTGTLINSIFAFTTTTGLYVTTQVGTRVSYAKYVISGTGIYGPRRRVIRPRRARVMVFTAYGRKIATRTVIGMRPNNFLAEALFAARK